MSFQVNCAKGCGYPLTVTDEMVAEATKHGAVLNVAHDICPPDQKVLPEYRATIKVERVSKTPSGKDGALAEGERGEVDKNDENIYVTPIASVGAVKSAASFRDAFEDLTNQINDQWEDVQKYREIVEG